MHLKHTIRAPQYLADCVQTIAQSSSCPGLRSANTTTYVKPCTRTKFGDAAYTLSNLLHQTLVLPRAVEAHRAVQSRHSEWSFIGSRASSHVRPNRSRSFLLLKSMSLLDVLSSFLKSRGLVHHLSCYPTGIHPICMTKPSELTFSYDWLLTPKCLVQFFHELSYLLSCPSN